MWAPALLLLVLPTLLPPASASDPGQPCPTEMNKIKDILEVNCTEQDLSAVPLGLPADTGILLLSANRLVSVSTAAFLPLAQLQDLDLSDNGLAALHTDHPLPTLKELILSRNALRALPALEGMPALTRLAVAHNNLTTLAPGTFHAVSALRDLDLRGNRLRTLPQEVFLGLTALKYLDLSDNLLEELPRDLLQDLENLETLWLSGNLLRTLPTDFFPEGHDFMYVFLTENPWHCDCGLRYLQNWILQNEDSVYQPERGLEKTKVEVAPERVLCHSPAKHRQTPVIDFKSSCDSVGDADAYNYEEETTENVITTATFTSHSPIPKESTAILRAVTSPFLTALRPPLSTPCSSTHTPCTSPVISRGPSTTTPVPTSLAVTPAQTPSAAIVLTSAPASTPPRATTPVPTSSLPTTMSTRPASTSSRPQMALATSTSNAHSTPVVSNGSLSSTSMALPSTAVLETSSSTVRSSPLLPSSVPAGSPTTLSSHAPTAPAPLDTTPGHPTQPAPSPPPAPPLCPCPTPGLVAHAVRSWAGREGPQWGQWVLRHCCLLHWVLYLASLALLVLTVLALAGWLAWMCLVGRPSWHKSLQNQEVRYPLLKHRESHGTTEMQLSTFKTPLQHTVFCTIKEVELCPKVTYCTIKDLGVQRSPPARSSFCTTKKLWIHRSPQDTSFQPVSGKVMVTNLSSLRTPSAYSLDRGVTAIGDVRVKYAGNTL